MSLLSEAKNKSHKGTEEITSYEIHRQKQFKIII